MSAVSPEAKARARAYSREYMRRKRAEKPELVREIAERWRNKDPAKAARIHRESVARWRAANPELAKRISRKANGLPEPTRPCPELCEVSGCGRKAACLDHNHFTGAFRGWLCQPCNKAATKNHSSTALRALADYLEQHGG